VSGIAGIAKPRDNRVVRKMLDKIAHRGNSNRLIETNAATLGIAWSQVHSAISEKRQVNLNPWDNGSIGYVSEAHGKFLLKRDPFGVVPMYYGKTREGSLCFSSEVKGLLPVTRDIHELPPGHIYDGQQLIPYFQIKKLPRVESPPKRIAKELHDILTAAVEKYASNGKVGAWLSGGVDSSVMAALARPYVDPFFTFAAGLPGSQDLKYARMVADFLHSDHHELLVNIKDLLEVLPKVIYHLESFDAWLVRSSIMNYLVGRLSAEYVPSVLSGEGGDELFGGYHYLKGLDSKDLPDELIDITSRLHNTALQRVDRCSSAHGIVAHVVFLDPTVVNFALRIPVEYKIKNGIEKWILRQAMADVLPPAVLRRPKSKFWQGSGVGDLLANYAEEHITDTDFILERKLPNGWLLRSKEELLYYRVFCERLGNFTNLDWMGRTKGVPMN
jgi:asparagine synthase (glutamine-hydrolysing)